ncbi:MAG: ATP-binding protein, partial [Anaerolineae bacterium]
KVNATGLMNTSTLEHILNVSRRMAETRALTPLLNYAIDEAITLTGAERGYVVLTHDDGALDFRAQRSRGGQELHNGEDQISRSILRQTIKSGRPLVLKDAAANPAFKDAESVVMLGLRSIMCVPLISRGNPIGAIYVENRSVRGRFSEGDLLPLILFANQAAVAIENAILIEELETRVAERTCELEAAMTQVEKSWAEAVEANRLRTVWVGNLAHDLGAPLAIASGALSMLQEETLGGLNAEQQEWIGKSLKAVQHAANLIEELFGLAKLESKGIALHKKTVSLPEFLQEVYAIGSGLPWGKEVEFTLDLASPLPALTIDPVRIHQVLLNLLSNACKFTAAGSVTLHARQLPGKASVCIGVADTGEGIAAGNFDRLFHRFEQFDNNPERRARGAGLGLAICRELVELHGGSIWIESAPGFGANFMFTLPLDAPPAS